MNSTIFGMGGSSAYNGGMLSRSKLFKKKRKQIFGSRPFPGLAQRLGLGGSGSSTRTLTNERKESASDGVGSDNVVSMVRYSLKVARPVKMIGFKTHHYRNDSVVSTSTEGVVAEDYFAIIGAAAQWTTDVVGTPTLGQSAKGWFSLNPIQGVPAGVRYGALTKPSLDSFVLQHVTLTMEIVNLSDHPSHIIIDFHKCTDSTTFLPGIWHDNEYIAPITAPDVAITLPAVGVAPTVALNFGASNGLLPWIKRDPGNNVSAIKDYWKSLSVKKFQLASGARRTIRVSIGMNMKMDSTTAVAGLTYLQGCLVARVRHFGCAMLLKDDLAGGVAGKMVHSISKIGCLATQDLTFRNTTEQLSKQERYTAMYNIPANNLVSKELFLDTDMNAAATNIIVS